MLFAFIEFNGFLSSVLTHAFTKDRNSKWSFCWLYKIDVDISVICIIVFIFPFRQKTFFLIWTNFLPSVYDSLASDSSSIMKNTWSSKTLGSCVLSISLIEMPELLIRNGCASFLTKLCCYSALVENWVKIFWLRKFLRFA